MMSAEDAATDTVTDAATGTATGREGIVGRFSAWRRRRPFIPGLLIILAGVVIMTPAYLTIEVMDILVMISTISGVSTLVIGAALVMFGLGTWFRPETSTYLGVFSIIVAIVALPTSNFGGFFVGTLLGIIGGVFALAWEDKEPVRPGRRRRHRARRRKRRQRDGAAAVASVVTAAMVAGSLTGGAGKVNAQDIGSGTIPVQGTSGTVTADRVTVSGNVRITVVPVDTVSGRVNAIKLSGDRLSATALGLDVPGTSTAKLRTPPGQDAQLTGGVEVLAVSLTAAPGVSDGPGLPVAVPVDIDGVVGKQLADLGIPEIGVPDQLMDVVDLRSVEMELIGLTAGDADMTGVSLSY